MSFREAIHPFDNRHFSEAMLEHLGCYQSIASRKLYRDGNNVKNVVLGCYVSAEGVTDPSMVNRMRKWALKDSFTGILQHPRESLQLKSLSACQRERSFREQEHAVARDEIFGTPRSHDGMMEYCAVDTLTDPLANTKNESASCLDISQVLKQLDATAVFQRDHSSNESATRHEDCLDTVTKMWQECGKHTPTNEECHAQTWGAHSPKNVLTGANLKPTDWFNPNESDGAPETIFPSLSPNDMLPAAAIGSLSANDTPLEISFLSPNGNCDNCAAAGKTVPSAGLRQGLENNGLVNNVDQTHVINKLRADLRRERNRISAFRCNEKKRALRDSVQRQIKHNREKVTILRDKEGMLRYENLRLKKLLEQHRRDSG